MKEVMEHPWFSNINWDTLETKEDQPPFALDVRLFFFLQVPNRLLTCPLR